MTNEIKVIGVGSPIVDLLAHVDDSFLEKHISGEKGGMVLIEADEMKDLLKNLDSEPFKAPGGSTGNTIFAMCRLGAKGSMLGKLGKDKDAKFYTDTLIKSGGDIQSFKYNENLPTALSACLVTPDTARTMRTHLGAAMTLSVDDIKKQDFKDFPLLHTEGYLIFNKELITHILKTAKDAGCTISLDLSSFEVVNASQDFLPELLKEYVDIIFANEDEAKAFCKTENFDEAADILSQYCKIAAVKLGSKGSIIKSGSELIRVEPVECQNPIDTTGAGDYWASGFLYGYLKGLKLEDCGKLASFIGAEVVSILGAELSDEQWEKINKFAKNFYQN